MIRRPSDTAQRQEVEMVEVSRWVPARRTVGLRAAG